MISAAQKKAKENFKKAIAYRRKTGCSLKEAFAHTYGKKVGAVKKAAPKKNAGFVNTVKLGTKKEVTYTKKSVVKPKKQPVKVSGFKNVIGALPIGFKGKLFGIAFKIVNQYDIYNDVSAIMEDTQNGNTITVFDGRGSAKDKAESIVNYVNKITGEDYRKVNSFYSGMLKFANNMQMEVKAFNAGKKKTIVKQPLIIAIPKKTVKKYTDKQLKEIASDAAYANGADLDRMTARLFDDKSLVTKYLKIINDWEIKNKTKIRVKTKKAAPKKATVKKADPKKAARKKTLHYAGTMHSQDGKKMYKYSLGGVKNELIDKLKNINKEISDYDNRVINIKNSMSLKDKNQKTFSREMIKNYKNIISELKTHSRELKKQI